MIYYHSNRSRTFKLKARMSKRFAALHIMSVLHNYFDGTTKLYLYLAKFSDILTKLIFQLVLINIKTKKKKKEFNY